MKQMHLELCNLAAADVYEANTLDTQSYSKSESEVRYVFDGFFGRQRFRLMPWRCCLEPRVKM
ncbi:hypothetical protein PF003_g3966 [Phytophthora fragariae]|nr:hypothetical protein PF003_g3966 [Phytophthora fragariae]